MADLGTGAFLRQAYENDWRRYQESLQPTAGSGWDVCILTASDARQAAVYQQLLDARRESGLLPPRTHFAVLPDPGGRRIGSGGATLRALALWPALLPGGTVPDIRRARLLIIHSGGDSKRLPHCSATGKLLARVPRELPDGRASTVFDEFLIGLTGLARNLPPGTLVVSGDVLLIFDHLQLTFQRGGVIGVAAAAPVEMAQRHGVYVSRPNSRVVRAYLHKASPDDLARWKGIAAGGSVQIDTGLLWFDGAATAKLLDLTGDQSVAPLCGLGSVDQPYRGGLHLYADLLLPLAGSTTLSAYLADESDGPVSEDVHTARRTIWKKLRGTPLSVERLQPAFFAHLGSSYEYWRLMAADAAAALTCNWSDDAAAWSPAGNGPDDTGSCAVMINSVVMDCPRGAPAQDRQRALIVDSNLGARLTWRGAALIASVHSAQPLDLAGDVAVHQLPFASSGYVTQVYGLHDDPKRLSNDASGTFMNRPWAQWLRELGMGPDIIWPGVPEDQRALWNARLYPLAADREQSLALALPLQDPQHAAAGWRGTWWGALRVSLAESSAQADVQRILDETAEIEDLAAARRLHTSVIAERPAAEARTHVTQIATRLNRRLQLAERWFAEADPVLQMRGYTALARASGNDAYEDRAFSILSTLIQGQILPQRTVHAVGNGPGCEPGSVVRAEACGRVDFGGGWTDTPPHSIERGGTVLNGAFTLHGAYPIVVEAGRLEERRLILNCRDIDLTLEPSTAGEVLAYANPADPFALLKAALVLRGLVNPQSAPDMPVAAMLAQMGCGLKLSTQTSIPRGSGLGTSSILAGALLACLARYQNQALSDQELFDEVLCLEQMLTTGGGWQDQVGGLVGGIKLVSSRPGLPQKLKVEPVRLQPEVRRGLAQRFLLVYTGQQRLAKDLLRNVMGRWMARDPEMVWLLRRIAELAGAMHLSLRSGDLDAFGRLLGEHWLLNKRMDPGCTNTFIDGLFEFMQPYICGGKLAGAGGGGFAAVVARDPQAAHDLARALADRYPGTPVGVWPCAIPDEALRVHVGPS